MKGVLLAGGTGSRLNPLTKVTNKHLLPVYRKPMIYYPIETLIAAGIKEILIVTGGEHIGDFFRLLGSGKIFNAHFSYEVQDGSDGTAAALKLAEDFVQDERFIVVLGDNILTENIKPYVDDFLDPLNSFKAKILIAKVNNPEKYGVVTLEKDRIVGIVEKPVNPLSSYVNTGLWMFNPEVFSLLKKVKLSKRGEFEITDVLDEYAKNGELTYSILQSEWTDAGSFDSLYNATLLMHKLDSNNTF